MELTLSRIRRVPSGIKRRLKSRLDAMEVKKNTKTLSIDNLLMGGEEGNAAHHYAILTDDLMRPSRRVAESPHVNLLKLFQEQGYAVLEPEVFEKTAYYKNGYECIDRVGKYFSAQDPAQLVEIARRFIMQFAEAADPQITLPALPPSDAFSSGDAPVSVRPIRDSKCYEIIDGHHRVAQAIMRGEKQITVLSKWDAVLTPMQKMLLEVLWNGGRHELYQPIAAPEVQDQWVLIRKCTDRLEMMRQFLAERQITPSKSLSYVDIGSSYGWFTAQMAGLGFESYGVERDPVACMVGQVAYGNQPSQLFRSDCVRFLHENKTVFDIVSCFSVLHHFVMGRGRVSAEELIRLIDDKTGQILFFDTGQNHEAWFLDSLKEWSVDYIEDWLRANTRFREIIRLGVDEDAVPPFQDNYSRTLFVCVR